MGRTPFSQVLKNASVDIRKEYDRLYKMFHYSDFNTTSLREWCDIYFEKFDFRNTCISLNDFDETNNFHFDAEPEEFDIDYLISFCEYSYNLVYNLAVLHRDKSYQQSKNYLAQVEKVIENIGYMASKQGNVTDFVPKDQAAISVAEIIDPNLSYKVIEYNHHSMKGDLERKKAILLALADKLEAMRPKLQENKSVVESDLFYLFNNINIRHNNLDKNGKNYKEFVANMNDNELENWYDDAYQMSLLAFLELEYFERKDRIKKLKENMQNKGEIAGSPALAEAYQMGQKV